MFTNSDALIFFNKTYNQGKSEKFSSINDHRDVDVKFIEQYTNNSSKVLDLGAGPCYLAEKLLDKVSRIDCVEPIVSALKKVSDNVKTNKNVHIYNCTIQDFTSTEKYDVVTAFGVMHYFNENECNKIYKKIRTILMPGGVLIVKNQFGLYDNVTIDSFSKEIGDNYFAQYRTLDLELNNLKSSGFKDVKVFAIYDEIDSANRFSNTHFYSLVAKV